MSDITVTFKNETILTMDASGSKPLLTQGKYCEDDISITYAKPTGPTGTKQISITQNGTTTEDVATYANAKITVNVQGGGGGIESGSFTPSSAQNKFSIPLTNAPSHFVMYSDNADFGTAAAWNSQYFMWNSEDQFIYISHYSTSNYRVKTDALINYSNGALTVSGLTDLLRANKVYKWFAW